MALRDQLDEQWRRTRERSPEIRQAYEALVRDLVASGLASSSLKSGDRLPDFELPTVEGWLIASHELLQKGSLVISRRQTEPQRRDVALAEARRMLLGGLGGAERLLQQRPHQPAELGELGKVALALEQRTAELILEFLNRPCQRRLHHIAGLRRAREVERLAQSGVVADLMYS